MKRIILGDPHGRWDPIIQIYNKEQPDEVIILGDYFDSFDVHPFDQGETFEKIIQLRKDHLNLHKGRFIMLIGNHDFHYMTQEATKGSGWNSYTAMIAGPKLCYYWDKEILDMIFVDEINKTIYSHAGVSINWFNFWIKSKSLGDINTIEAKAFKFVYKDGGDCRGSSSWNSPLWIRPKGLKTCPYKDKDGIVWSQVFGHTETIAPNHWIDNEGEFYCIDCINEAYLVENFDDNKKLIERNLQYYGG